MLAIDNWIHALLALISLAGLFFIFLKKKPGLRTPRVPDISASKPVDVPAHDIGTISQNQKIRSLPVIPVTINDTSLMPPSDEETNATLPEPADLSGTDDPRSELPSYRFPTIDLLQEIDANQDIAKQDVDENKNIIVNTLGHFGIHIDQIKATIAPTATLYELVLPIGVRIARIKKLEAELALRLSVSGLRILGHIPGTGNVGIEILKNNPDIVTLRSLIKTNHFQTTTMSLPVILGKDMRNELVMADLAKLPHLLIGGATGQGKSVGINAMLLSLLYKKHPAELKLVLIDIKQLELSSYRKIERQYLTKLAQANSANVNTPQQAAEILNALCIEMDCRYDVLRRADVRDLNSYNVKFIKGELSPGLGHRYLPYIVVVIDELADLVAGGHVEGEASMRRLSQLGRSSGIHLIISTQYPSVGIIHGIIKANFPARIAFRFSSLADSRTILNDARAAQLKGNGDFLFANGPDIIHVQGSYVSTAEIEQVCTYIGEQVSRDGVMLLPSQLNVSLTDKKQQDTLFEEAARLVVMHQQGSTSLIQRKLKLGYSRAGLIIDQLEAAGIIGPFEGSKAREVLIPDDYSLDLYLQSLI